MLPPGGGGIALAPGRGGGGTPILGGGGIPGGMPIGGGGMPIRGGGGMPAIIGGGMGGDFILDLCSSYPGEPYISEAVRI